MLGLAATWVAAIQRPPGLDYHALRIAEAFVAGDAATLAAYTDPDELKRLGLEPSGAERLIRELVVPRAKAWSALDPTIETQVFALGAQGVARVHWKGNGMEAVLMFSVEPTDHGPKCRLMQHVVRAWDLDWRRTAPHGPVEPTAEGRLAGLRQDRPVLEALGITGLTRQDLDEPLATWDDMERIWRTGRPEDRGGSDPR